MKLLSHFHGIESVEVLKTVLGDYPDKMKICDVSGEPLDLRVFEDKQTGERTLVVD
ncbi:MAG: hypothetical protein AB7D06_17095 [Pedobacter sp.]